MSLTYECYVDQVIIAAKLEQPVKEDHLKNIGNALERFEDIGKDLGLSPQNIEKAKAASPSYPPNQRYTLGLIGQFYYFEYRYYILFSDSPHKKGGHARNNDVTISLRCWRKQLT